MAAPIKVALLGATGRMGKEIVDVITVHPAVSLSGASAGPAHRLLGQPFNSDSNILLQTPAAALEKAQVVIDFSLPCAVSEHLALCVKAAIPYVCGVTGLNRGLLDHLDRASETIPVLWSPNMSAGVNIAFAACADIAHRLEPGFTVEILDIHHAGKQDSPSGTALEFGRLIQQSARFNPEIDYQSVREGQHPGEHHIKFRQAGEVLELRHRAGSRLEFARGALRCALWLKDQRPGRYNMRNLIEKL